MYTIADFDAFFEKIAPAHLSESWDNDGIMLCKGRDTKVKKVLIALEIRKSVIDYAVKGDFDLIITHHPFIFKKMSRICDDDYQNIKTLIDNGISVMSFHTRLDSAQGGVNDVLAKVLGLTDVDCFGGETGNIGRIGMLDSEMSSNEFALYLKDKLNCDIRCTVTSRNVKKVALVGGAGKDFIFDGIRLGADAFVTSEVPHHIFTTAQESNFNLYDCGHYYTENPVCNELYSVIKENFKDICVSCFDVGCPYTCIL